MFFLLQVESVRLLDRVSPRRSRVGTLYLTATHTIFVENEAGVRSETWVIIRDISQAKGSSTGKCLGKRLAKRL